MDILVYIMRVPKHTPMNGNEPLGACAPMNAMELNSEVLHALMLETEM